MADEHDRAGAPAPAPGTHEEPASLDAVLTKASGQSGSDGILTILVAFAANVLVAVAKTGAALITGSASLTAEAAHSWADSGNEVFLFIANRRAARAPDGAARFAARVLHRDLIDQILATSDPTLRAV